MDKSDESTGARQKEDDQGVYEDDWKDGVSAEDEQETQSDGEPASSTTLSKPDGAVVGKTKAGKGKVAKNATEAKRKREKKPRRALSAYNFFFREERAKLAAELESTPAVGSVDTTKSKNDPGVFTEMGRIVAQRWREISPAELARYKRMADEDMDRYSREMAEYQIQLARRQRIESEQGERFDEPGGGKSLVSHASKSQGGALPKSSSIGGVASGHSSYGQILRPDGLSSYLLSSNPGRGVNPLIQPSLYQTSSSILQGGTAVGRHVAQGQNSSIMQQLQQSRVSQLPLAQPLPMQNRSTWQQTTSLLQGLNRQLQHELTTQMLASQGYPLLASIDSQLLRNAAAAQQLTASSNLTPEVSALLRRGQQSQQGAAQDPRLFQNLGLFQQGDTYSSALIASLLPRISGETAGTQLDAVTANSSSRSSAGDEVEISRQHLSASAEQRSASPADSDQEPE